MEILPFDAFYSVKISIGNISLRRFVYFNSLNT